MATASLAQSTFPKQDSPRLGSPTNLSRRSIVFGGMAALPAAALINIEALAGSPDAKLIAAWETFKQVSIEIEAAGGWDDNESSLMLIYDNALETLLYGEARTPAGVAAQLRLAFILSVDQPWAMELAFNGVGDEIEASGVQERLAWAAIQSLDAMGVR